MAQDYDIFRIDPRLTSIPQVDYDYINAPIANIPSPSQLLDMLNPVPAKSTEEIKSDITARQDLLNSLLGEADDQSKANVFLKLAESGLRLAGAPGGRSFVQNLADAFSDFPAFLQKMNQERNAQEKAIKLQAINYVLNAEEERRNRPTKFFQSLPDDVQKALLLGIDPKSKEGRKLLGLGVEGEDDYTKMFTDKEAAAATKLLPDFLDMNLNREGLQVFVNAVELMAKPKTEINQETGIVEARIGFLPSTIENALKTQTQVGDQVVPMYTLLNSPTINEYFENQEEISFILKKLENVDVPEGFSDIQFEQAYGIPGSFVRAISGLVSPFVEELPYPDATRGKTELNLLQKDTMKELKKFYPGERGQFFMKLMESITDFVPVNVNFKTALVALEQLESTRNYIDTGIKLKKDIIENPQEFSIGMVREAKEDLDSLYTLRVKYDFIINQIRATRGQRFRAGMTQEDIFKEFLPKKQ
jgi:hypothetical protein